MNKLLNATLLALFLTGALFVVAASAQGTGAIDVAANAPSPAKTPITKKNLPVYLDEDLASKHADFTKFARTKVSTLNRNHRLSESRMQITRLSDGTYKARFHRIDTSSLVSKVRRSKSRTVPYVAVLSYKEQIYECVGASPEECRNGNFIPVMVIPNRHIFSYKKGGWR